MGLFDAQNTQDALADVMRRERAAILNGAFDTLEALTNEKERLINALSKSRPSADVLDSLKEQSERNTVLLDSMRTGIATALDRIRTIRQPRSTLRTYDQSGRRTAIASGTSKTSRRA